MTRILDFDDSFTSASTPSTISPTDLYNVVIASTGEDFVTHATWDAYVADSPANGDRILVLSSYTLNSNIQLTVDDLFVWHQGNIEYTKGTATKAFEITGDRARWYGGRFLTFSTVSDVAFEIASTASFTRVRDMSFNNCDTNINDLGSASSLLGNVDETP